MTLGIRYTDFEALELRLSNGNDHFFVESTHTRTRSTSTPATRPR